MEERLKLAILGLTAIASPMPISVFFLFSFRYIVRLFNGTGTLEVNFQQGMLEIYPSKILNFIPPPLRISFLEIAFNIASTIIFVISLILIIKILHTQRNAKNMH